MSYYDIKTMDAPNQQMYFCEQISKSNILLIGTATPIQWGVTIDIDPNSPAKIQADGFELPFADKQFEVVILDYVTNFVKPKLVKKLITEANRVGVKVMGRATFEDKPRTLKGPKQRFTHPVYKNVEWINHE